jgi:hypothetical protein
VKKPPTYARVKLADITVNPRNSNVMPEESLVKLVRNIKRTGHYPPLILRPLDEPGADKHGGRSYMFIDGFHRSLALDRLGETEANAEIWDVTEREADVMLATINTLRGSDDKKLRAALIDSLTQTIPIEQLAQMLPEDKAGIEDLQKLMQVDLDALEIAAREAVEKSEGESPQPLNFILFPEQMVKVRNALEHLKTREDLHGKKNPEGQALYYMAVDYLSGVGWDEANAELASNLPPIGGGGGSGMVDTEGGAP